jgi:hypothetical protein
LQHWLLSTSAINGVDRLQQTVTKRTGIRVFVKPQFRDFRF